MSDTEKGERVPKDHGAAVREAIEDHKKHHVSHVSTPRTSQGLPTGPDNPDAMPFQGNGGAIL